MSIRIVPATEADVPLIFRLISALAEYERLSHQVVATEAALRETLFGNKPAAEVVIAYVDERAGRLRAVVPQLLDIPRPAGTLPRGSLRAA